MSRIFLDSLTFSLLVPNFVKGNSGSQFAQDLAKVSWFIPVQRIFLDIRGFFKVRKLGWSYSVSLTIPMLATLFMVHGRITPFFL
jgi:hypothetical protein